MARKADDESRIDVYETVTSRILTALERGVAPWIRPWDARDGGAGPGVHRNVATGRAYRGINTLLLWLAGEPYQSRLWGTFMQWRDRGGHVRRGEKATQIVFYRQLAVADERTGERERVYVLRRYSVFNAMQVEGIDGKALEGPRLQPRTDLVGRDPALDRWVERTGADVRVGGTKACYVPSRDVISMPAPARFSTSDDWYATLAHELAHWTGSPARLDRNLSGWRASPAYAFEELVAEISSAFTCARLSIRLDRLQHAAYIASWCTGMRDHKTMIVSAASAAQRATDYLFNAAGEAVSLPAELPQWGCCMPHLGRRIA
jgi:antirestriction protein ArdC